MLPFNIFAKIKHNTREEVKYKRETDSQKGRVDKKQPYFRDRDVKAFAQVGANTKRVPFKKCNYPLQHVKPFLVSYFQRRIAGISYNCSNCFSAPAKPANQKRY